MLPKFNQLQSARKIAWPTALALMGFIIFLAAPIYADTPLPAFSVAWGAAGSNEGEFDAPAGVAVDSSGNVYVVDELNHRVQKFTHNGQFLLEWGGQGSAPGQFLAPTAVAVDSAGNVYITDTDNNRLTNNGPVTATQGLISETLDSNLQFAGPVQLDPPQPGAIVATSALSLPLLVGNIKLSPLAALTVTVPVTVNAGLSDPTAIFNTAAMISSEFILASRGTALVIVNPYQTYLPILIKGFP